MPEEQRQAVTEITQPMITAVSEDHTIVGRGFQNNQHDLAQTIYLLCHEDWPDDARIPPGTSEVYSGE